MSGRMRIASLSAGREDRVIVIEIVTVQGQTITLLATLDQADRLVDELEDALSEDEA